MVPNSATVEMSGEESGFSKHVPCSATEQPATPASAWDRYERENSWEENASKVLEAFGR